MSKNEEVQLKATFKLMYKIDKQASPIFKEYKNHSMD
jgi:hypothetical protein